MLYFFIKQGDSESARVQLGLTFDNGGFKEIRISMDLYVHPDIDLLSKYSGKVDGLIISEYWNNHDNVNPLGYPFRIHVEIYKGSASANTLTLSCQAQIKDYYNGSNQSEWKYIWREDSNIVLPIGQWMHP